MNSHTFIAESVADAVTQIRETLGPEAVVLNVRRLPAAGLARLWQRPRIEVVAHVPELATPALPVAESPDPVAELRHELQALRERIAEAPALPVQPEGWNWGESPAVAADPEADGGWRVGALLESTGLLPVHARRVVEELRSRTGGEPPATLAGEIELAGRFLAGRWRSAALRQTGAHVFVGAPGAGKTTALCKWLAQVALVEGRTAAVWRLDGHVANTAESLSVFGEIFGVPVERFAPANGELPEAEVLFVDLPGVNPGDASAMTQLARRLAELPSPQVHLVVNAAYETSHLLAQVRAFASLPVQDVIVTHLDEETRWGKLWNLVLGTNCTLGFLSAGQNVPGEFRVATADLILTRQFPRKSAGISIPRG